MGDKMRFATDLYRGTAEYYDRYRLPYPEALIADLVRRAQVSGHGRLLDLACGTGQLAFPLSQWFSEVWAVDQEPDMVEAVRAKAAAAGTPDGYLALCWSSVPTAGAEDWQRALAAALDRWRAALGAEHRVPADWDELRRQRPDFQVLSGAGFEVAGRHQFTAEHRWSLPGLVGYIRSTSVLPAAVLGDHAAESGRRAVGTGRAPPCHAIAPAASRPSVS